MTYQEAMDFLEETKKYGSVLSLDSIRALMSQLNDVQEKVPVIHVAGTNGKGSVGAFLSSVYQKAGYHVGRFATPDVFSYEEEFLYDGKPIDKNELAHVFEKVKNGCKWVEDAIKHHPTRFEVETAAAFLWFFEKKIDIAIVEVGMGGESDATNVIQKPVASVLTSISMDHMGFLGNSLEEIATVKAGIIKEGCPVVSTWQDAEVERIIREQSNRSVAPICFSNKERLSENDLSNSFSYKKYIDLSISLMGEFQKQNAVLAIDVVECLQHRFPITEEQLRDGLANAKWPGRFERVCEEPEFYIDGAHNIAAARCLRATLDKNFPERRIIYIMGILSDKEYEEIADVMFQEGDIVYGVTPDNPRALSAMELCDVLRDKGVRAYEFTEVSKAVHMAIELAQLSEDVIVAFGSLSYLKDVKREIYEIYR